MYTVPVHVNIADVTKSVISLMNNICHLTDKKIYHTYCRAKRLFYTYMYEYVLVRQLIVQLRGGGEGVFYGTCQITTCNLFKEMLRMPIHETLVYYLDM